MGVYFSVVIPLYNKEPFVAKTITSVLNQTYQNFEIIVVNDFSTDNSLRLVEKIDDHRIKITEHNEKKGVSASRNTGINAATYSYIAFIDADDVWDRKFLETIVSLIKEYPEESVFATHYRRNFNGKNLIPKTRLLDKKIKGKSLIIDDFFKVNMGPLIITQSCFVAHKTVFKTVGIYDENVTSSEDIDFYIRCFSFYNLAYQFFELCTIINEDPNSLTKRKSSNQIFPELQKYLCKSDSLNKFINFYHYCFYRKMKKEGALDEMKYYQKKINYKYLKIVQIIIIFMPVMVYQFLLKLKTFFSKREFYFTSY